MSKDSPQTGKARVALYSPETGFNRSAIMTGAIASARESREFQTRYAASAAGNKAGFKPRSWRFLISQALHVQWGFARAERYPYELAKATPAYRAWLASVSTDGRLHA